MQMEKEPEMAVKELRGLARYIISKYNNEETTQRIMQDPDLRLKELSRLVKLEEANLEKEEGIANGNRRIQGHETSKIGIIQLESKKIMSSN
jgi:hypothetical protein